MYLPLLISKLCSSVNFTNFGQIGTCFLEFGFFGDLTLAGIVIFSVFVGFVVRYNLPGNLILPLGVALAYALYLLSGGAPHFLVLLIIALVIFGVLLVMGVINYINR